jgi:phosphoribosylglycinamide formyltransferase-1
MALPEATCKHMNGHASFSVRKKTFAYYLNDHHGDGVVAVCCKVLPGDNAVLSRSDPARFYLPAYIGAKGWVGLRVDLGEIIGMRFGNWQSIATCALPPRLCANKSN